MAKRPVKKRAAKARSGKPAAKKSANARAEIKAERTFSDFEELLVRNLTVDRTGGVYKDVSVQEMILGLTAAGRKLAYESGFEIGMGLNASSEKIDALFKALEKFGLGKVLYNPSEEHLIVTSKHPRYVPSNLGSNLHEYESGMIAGYLTASTGENISVKEARCVYNGFESCQFIAEPRLHGPDYGTPLDSGQVVDAIARTIKNAPHGVIESNTEHDYCLLPTLLLMRRPIADESSRVLYVAGIRLAELSRDSPPSETIGKIGYYFDMKHAGLANLRGNRRVIRLKYKHYNSIDQLVRLSASMLVGFANAAFGSEAELEMSVDADRSYLVNIKLRSVSEITN